MDKESTTFKLKDEGVRMFEPLKGIVFEHSNGHLEACCEKTFAVFVTVSYRWHQVNNLVALFLTVLNTLSSSFKWPHFSILIASSVEKSTELGSAIFRGDIGPKK